MLRRRLIHLWFGHDSPVSVNDDAREIMAKGVAFTVMDHRADRFDTLKQIECMTQRFVIHVVGNIRIHVDRTAQLLIDHPRQF